MSPEEVVRKLRDMDAQIIHGRKPSIFSQAADLIEEKEKPRTISGVLVSNR